MKKLLYLTLIATISVVACKKEPEPETKPIAVESISLDRTADTLIVGQTLTLVATVLPDSATEKTVNWTSSDTAIATVNNGIVSAIAFGKVVITATTKDGNKTAICNIVVDTINVPIDTVYRGKLPSIMFSETFYAGVSSGVSETEFWYDNLNRWEFVDYNPDGTIAYFSGFTFQYVGNMVIAKVDNRTDTLFLNDKGQVIKTNDGWSFTYNSNGNLEKRLYTDVNGITTTMFIHSYTDIPTIFRHVNMPEWFWMLFTDMTIMYNKGYMTEQIVFGDENISGQGAGTFTYEEVDDKGYVIKMKFDEGGGNYTILTFEYINAKPLK
jgi:hypothetical protein